MGLSPSRLQRLTRAMERRNSHPALWVWEAGDRRHWLTRLVEVGAGEGRPEVSIPVPPRRPRLDTFLQELAWLRVCHRCHFQNYRIILKVTCSQCRKAKPLGSDDPARVNQAGCDRAGLTLRPINGRLLSGLLLRIVGGPCVR